MSHYKSNLRDIEFNLFEGFGRQELLGVGPFAEVDEETALYILAEVNRLATGAAGGVAGRRRPQPAGLRPPAGNVTMRPSRSRSRSAR